MRSPADSYAEQSWHQSSRRTPSPIQPPCLIAQPTESAEWRLRWMNRPWQSQTATPKSRPAQAARPLGHCAITGRARQPASAANHRKARRPTICQHGQQLVRSQHPSVFGLRHRLPHVDSPVIQPPINPLSKSRSRRVEKYSCQPKKACCSIWNSGTCAGFLPWQWASGPGRKTLDRDLRTAPAPRPDTRSPDAASQLTLGRIWQHHRGIFPARTRMAPMIPISPPPA